MSSKSPTYGEQGQPPFRKPARLRILALLGFGGMLVVLLGLLSGCGADSTTGEAVKGKNTKTSTSLPEKNSQSPTMLLMEGKGSSGPSGIAGIKKQPKDKSVQIPGKSREELKARNDAAVKKAQSRDFEVMPGVTREELKARNAAAVEKVQSPGFEVMRGVTREQLKARNAAAVEKAQSRGFEVMPGVTREELKAKNDAAMNAPKPLSVGGNREISSPAGGK